MNVTRANSIDVFKNINLYILCEISWNGPGVFLSLSMTIYLNKMQVKMLRVKKENQ